MGDNFVIVESIMNKQVITVTPETTLAKAHNLVRENRIRHLPVVDGESLVGVLSDRDLRSACPSVLCKEDPGFMENIQIGQIMNTNVITVHPLDFIEEAARIVYEQKIGCLPVVSKNKLLGIVTATDILNRLIENLGLTKPGAHLEVEVPNRPGMLSTVSGIIGSHGVNIISALVLPEKTGKSFTLVFRLQAFSIRKIIEEIEAAGYKILWPLYPKETV